MTSLHIPSGPLCATGQLVDRTPGTHTCKDDGGERRGIADSNSNYTILTAGQYSGTTTITVNGKNDSHSNACVYDRVTQLMWTQTAPGSIGAGNNGLLKWYDSVSGEDIFNFCSAANTAGLAGYSDWRLPNINEMASLLLWTVGTTPYINQAAFSVSFGASNSFWTGMENPANATQGVLISLANFGIVGQTKTTVNANILLCRLGYK